MDKKMFVETMAKICYYGQEHSRDWGDFKEKHTSFEHISHIISCFIAQNTVGGKSDGCESFVVLPTLMNNYLTLDGWINFFEDLIDNWGGVA